MGSKHTSSRFPPPWRFRILAIQLVVLLLLASAFIFNSPLDIIEDSSGEHTRSEDEDGNTTTSSRDSNRTRDNRRDSDDDGVDDDKEMEMRTDPDNPDTDSDGIPDGEDYYPLDSSLWRSPFEILSQVIIEISVFLILIFSYVTYRKLKKRGDRESDS